MTRQHIRFSALRSIFWGTLLLFLDFDLNFRFGFSFTLPLLPNCIGFWLVARGTRSLAANRPSLGLLGPFWLALGLWSLQQFFPGLSPHIPGALSLLAALVRMYADFQLFTDLAGLAEALLPGAPLPRQLRSARTAAVLLTTLFYFQDLLADGGGRRRRLLRPHLHPAPAVAALPGHGSRSGGIHITRLHRPPAARPRHTKNSEPGDNSL